MYPNSLVSRVFGAKYFRDEMILQAELTCAPSYIWRSIDSSMPFFRWHVRDGNCIRLMNDVWAHSGDHHLLMGKEGVQINNNQMVNVLIHGNTWNQGMIHEWFEDMEAQLIICTPLPNESRADNPIFAS